LVILALAGVVLMAGAQISGRTICPMIKRIWTPSWTLFSGACVIWLLAGFFVVFDLVKLRRLAFPLMIVGMNSIFVYVLACLLRPWTWKMIEIHLGWIVKSSLGGSLQRLVFGSEGFNPVFLPIVESLSVLLVFWLVCLWMYRHRIFVKI
jgi:predicted acyltransferase